MFTLIKNGEIYGPEYMGQKDVLFVGNKIGFIEDMIDVPANFVEFNLRGLNEWQIVVLGFIDAHPWRRLRSDWFISSSSQGVNR
ncbi:hypothetical protein [Peribacillus simplex]|uniref:hypothetical protein n=1 Tax=Peribacillus simplex TaxID=1478 RepID=UPI003D2D32FD